MEFGWCGIRRCRLGPSVQVRHCCCGHAEIGDRHHTHTTVPFWKSPASSGGSWALPLRRRHSRSHDRRRHRGGVRVQGKPDHLLLRTSANRPTRSDVARPVIVSDAVFQNVPSFAPCVRFSTHCFEPARLMGLAAGPRHESTALTASANPSKLADLRPAGVVAVDSRLS
jgi:hypothetical protein